MRQVDALEIDALLPQTQCTRCNYAGCLPYAQAIAADEAPINQCPPGGIGVIGQLAKLLDREPLALNPRHGVESPVQLAWIDPEVCIGCARCLPPCPVDAILGAQRQLHTVIVSWCTGCALCVASCPVDCIHMVDWPRTGPEPPLAKDNRQRHVAHTARVQTTATARARELADLKNA